MDYIFFLPPNTADDRDARIPHDQEVASLEGEHWKLEREIAERQTRLGEVTTELSQRQPSIVQAAREERIRIQAEQDARQRVMDEAEAERQAQADAAAADELAAQQPSAGS